MGMSLLHLVTPKANQVRWREGHFIWSGQRLNYRVLWRPHTLSHSWLSKQTRPATQYHKWGWSHSVWGFYIPSSAVGNFVWNSDGDENTKLLPLWLLPFSRYHHPDKRENIAAQPPWTPHQFQKLLLIFKMPIRHSILTSSNDSSTFLFGNLWIETLNKSFNVETKFHRFQIQHKTILQ